MDDLPEELKKAGEAIADAFTSTVQQDMKSILSPVLFSPDNLIHETIAGEQFIEISIDYKYSGRYYRIRVEQLESFDGKG